MRGNLINMLLTHSMNLTHITRVKIENYNLKGQVDNYVRVYSVRDVHDYRTNAPHDLYTYVIVKLTFKIIIIIFLHFLSLQYVLNFVFIFTVSCPVMRVRGK